jgi:hypothetical protein
MSTGRSFTKLLGSLVVASSTATTGLASSPAPAADAQPAAMTADAARSAAPTSGSEPAAVAPRINRRVPSRVRSTLEAGFELAVQKLSEESACRDLFADLGADGLETLSNTLYYQADLKMEQRVCPRAFGFTVVGGAPTWVCQRFARLNDWRAAAVLLHEALHHAGMDEWPHDPDGPTPGKIDDLVAEACGF